jgi:chaperonin cofactor prefoldin
MPAQPVDFNGLMADVQKMQQFLAKVQGGLKEPKQKEVLGELMARIDQARADVETSYPEAVKTIRESAERTNQQVAELQKQNDAHRQKLAELQAAAAAKPPAPKPTVRRPKIRPLPALTFEPGNLLRKELLQRFAGLADQKSKTDDREIWEDWNWEA